MGLKGRKNFFLSRLIENFPDSSLAVRGTATQSCTAKRSLKERGSFRENVWAVAMERKDIALNGGVMGLRKEKIALRIIQKRLAQVSKEIDSQPDSAIDQAVLSMRYAELTFCENRLTTMICQNF